MNVVTHSSAVACPGCVTSPAPVSDKIPKDARIVLSLPAIHCQGCISKAESGLHEVPGVNSARVNLSLKRVVVDASDEITAPALVEVLGGIGIEAHELDTSALKATQSDNAGRDLLMRLAVAGFASMNVMLLSVAVWSGAEGSTRDLFHWISAAIAIPAVAFAAHPFFHNAWSALSVGRLNMDVPISLAILLALATSLWETSLSGHHAYFDAALMLTFFLLGGRYLDHRTRAVARSAAEELSALEVPRAWRLDDGTPQEVPVSALGVGDLFLVRPGGRMPVDGEVLEGQSELDRSLLTGETLPVFAGKGQRVSAGEVNLTGPLTIRATAVGSDTSLHRMADLVSIAESGRSRYTSLADKAAKLYAPGVHILAALSFLGWLIWSGDIRISVNVAAAVLIITCPCALGLAVPAVTTAASGRMFRMGLLIKDATALERLSQVDTVVFDKTGTLTSGKPSLSNIDEHNDQDLSVALALAEASSHPMSSALVTAVRAESIVPADLTNITEIPGFGVEALWNGKEVRLGRASWTGAASSCETATFLRISDEPAVAFTFIDTLRSGALETVRGLRQSGKSVWLISGDTAGAVQDLANLLCIKDWIAEALPDEKAARVSALMDAGEKVLMVGDGLNDTVALAAAHVSISPASALDAARVASDIVLIGSDLSPIPGALEMAGRATSRIRENFRIATLYNLIAVPIAVFGLATPLVAALAMSASSITVSLNALRLR